MGDGGGRGEGVEEVKPDQEVAQGISACLTWLCLGTGRCIAGRTAARQPGPRKAGVTTQPTMERATEGQSSPALAPLPTYTMSLDTAALSRGPCRSLHHELIEPMELGTGFKAQAYPKHISGPQSMLRTSQSGGVFPFFG